MKKVDVTGQRFGHLVAIERIGSKNEQALWRCQCCCGNTVDLPLSYFRSGDTKSCGCLSKENKREKHYHWSGCGELTGTYLGTLKAGATDRKMEWSVTPEYLWDLFIKQDCKCAITGIDLVFSGPGDLQSQTASLDRINPEKGYVPGNVQWVHKRINLIKWCLQPEEFIGWCKMVALNQQKKNESQQEKDIEDA